MTKTQKLFCGILLVAVLAQHFTVVSFIPSNHKKTDASIFAKRQNSYARFHRRHAVIDSENSENSRTHKKPSGSGRGPTTTSGPRVGTNEVLRINYRFDREPIRRKDDVGTFDNSKKLPGRQKEVKVGNPQIKVEKEISVSEILTELAAIQTQGPQKYCVLGTRHCSYLHQQIIELLAYALVLSGNHVYTSGAGGTHAAAIRGALRAESPELLTVVLPQSFSKQQEDTQDLLQDVEDIIDMPQNDGLSLNIASRICNSYMLSKTDQLISFAFHESNTVIEAQREARELDMLVTTLFLD